MNRKQKMKLFNLRLQNECKMLDSAADKAKHADKLILDIDEQFEKVTKLNKKDISFLVVAIALQLVRQYVIGTLLNNRMNHNEADKKIKDIESKAQKEFEKPQNRKHRYYHPSLEEVICYPVSYDVNIGSNGRLRGGGIFGHRAKTAGHDPLIGLVLGTANIATSTVTTLPDFKSYHVTSGQINGRNYNTMFGNDASTYLVLKYTIQKVLSKNLKQMTIVAVALIREVNHLISDIHSKNSLPLPFVSAISTDMANELAKIGLDAAGLLNIGIQASISSFINVIIAMLHRLCYNENEISKDFFCVKTRKIINYSNIIASSSNILASLVGATVGAVSDNPKIIKKSIEYLDIGGIIIAISTFFKDNKNVYEIKREFMRKEWYKMVKGE